MAFGAALMSVRSSVRPSCASIHVRSPERGATTTVAPRAASEALSPAATIGTRVTCETLSNVGSMRTTVRPVSAGLAAIAAQSRPPATVRLCAARRSALSRSRDADGEIRESDDESRAETHTDLEPKAIAPGREPIEIDQGARACRVHDRDRVSADGRDRVCTRVAAIATIVPTAAAAIASAAAAIRERLRAARGECASAAS